MKKNEKKKKKCGYALADMTYAFCGFIGNPWIFFFFNVVATK